jgi:hypothetical protein
VPHVRGRFDEKLPAIWVLEADSIRQRYSAANRFAANSCDPRRRSDLRADRLFPLGILLDRPLFHLLQRGDRRRAFVWHHPLS